MQPRNIAAAFMISLTLSISTGATATAADDWPRIREQKTVVVNGKPERWRLEWERKPTPACGADEQDVSLTCPCSGFAFGEQGPLALVRVRSDGKTERLELGPLFGMDGDFGAGNREAVLQRWAPIETGGPESDFQHALDDDFAAKVAKRPDVDVMQFADFDHDGQATEFLLQVNTLPCGKHQMVLVGVSKANPHLHVFSAAEKPEEPLVLGSWEWEALRQTRGPIAVVDWNCGDHGSEKEWRVRLSTDSGVIHASKTSDYCADVKQSPLYPEILKLNDLYHHGKLSEQEFSTQELKLLEQVMESPR